jgi:hypothetical protein
MLMGVVDESFITGWWGIECSLLGGATSYGTFSIKLRRFAGPKCRNDITTEYERLNSMIVFSRLISNVQNITK